ncbi:MAG: PEGA domain-containing protein [Pseudomonadales bacterium]
MSDQQPENPTIEPAKFSRAETGRQRPRLVPRPIPIVVASIFIVLALATLFMFTARAVRFDIQPTPDALEVTGGLFTWQFGERYLMLSGTYTVTAAKEGYHNLVEDVTVGEEADQRFSFTMEKLPGILTINSRPVENADVIVDQKHAGTTPLTIEQIEPGIHDIEVNSDRYLPTYTEVEIKGMRQEQRLELELEPAWAEVTLKSSPEGATVSIDGKERGETPVTLEILQGEHQVEVRNSGYKVWQSQVNVTAGEDKELPLVELVKADGRVSVTTDPPGANVTIGGRYRGQSPLEVSLAPGETYQVLLSTSGYREVERTLEVNPDEDVQLNVKLSPVLGEVRIEVQPSGGTLYVNGEAMGEPSQKLTLPAREHEIRIEKPGYATHTQTITPQPGITRQLMITLLTEAEAEIARIPETVTTPLGQELKLVIPDKLTMGAGRREPGRRSNEIIREVELTRPYYLGVHEVTNKEFTQFDPDHKPGFLGRALLNRDERPVVNVSWQDAVEFCNWLSEKQGLPKAYKRVGGEWQLVEPVNTGYRLPTEAEWAWAGRFAGGDNPTLFPWGETLPPPEEAGNFADESAEGMVPYYLKGYNDNFRGPSPVGSFPPNELGLHDLAGNAAEWVHDYYSIDRPRETLVDPTGPETGNYHVIRGSSYMHGRFGELRWTFRDYGDKPRPDVGFRIARYVE